jgi:TonB family protein
MFSFVLALAAAAPAAPVADQAIKPDQVGATVIELSISATGKVDKCKAVVSSGDAKLDDKACKLFLETEYQPSKDAAGKPVASVERISLAWAQD